MSAVASGSHASLPGRLIGRDEELRQILGLLTIPAPRRPVTLCGQAGVGKTALALSVAGRLEALGRRVVVVRLANTRDADEMLLAIAAEIGLPAGDGGILERLTVVGDETHTLILDNCEHLSGDPHPLASLLDAWPRVRLLATSVRPLRLHGEQVVVIGPLELPTPDDDPQALRDSPAVQLYLRRAAEASPTFDPDTARLPDVARLCDRVGALPLGIELLAARVRTLPPGSTGSLLRSGSLIGLEQPRSGAPVSDRHRSLRDALRWSYELVSPDAAALLRRMSVFAAPLTLERLLSSEISGAFEATGPSPVGSRESTILDQLAELVDVQLVRQRDVQGHPTFELLPVVREFALEELERHDEAAAARRSRRSAISAFAESRKAALGLAAERIPMSDMSVCEMDLRQVLAEYVDDDALVPGMRLATVLAIVAFQRGYDSYVADALERMIAAADSDERVPEPCWWRRCSTTLRSGSSPTVESTSSATSRSSRRRPGGRWHPTRCNCT